MPNPAYVASDAAVVDSRSRDPAPMTDAGTPADPPDGAPAVDQAPDQPVDQAFDETRDQAADLAQDRPAERPPLPARQAVVESAALSGFFGAMGGSGQSLLCNPGEILVGYHVSAGTTNTGAPVVEGLRAMCGRLEVSVSDGSYRIQALLPRQLSALGAGTANSLMALCPADEALVGFFGRAGMRLDQVGFRCSAIRVANDAAMTVTLVPSRSFGPVPTTSNESEFSDDCDPGTVAVGHLASHGAWIDGLGLHCGRLRLVP